jgi:TPP-dependent pyruvate/acetoin dehydrogenase alpha subunit
MICSIVFHATGAERALQIAIARASLSWLLRWYGRLGKDAFDVSNLMEKAIPSAHAKNREPRIIITTTLRRLGHVASAASFIPPPHS